VTSARETPASSAIAVIETDSYGRVEKIRLAAATISPRRTSGSSRLQRGVSVATRTPYPRGCAFAHLKLRECGVSANAC
jgi:hypothetical protein